MSAASPSRPDGSLRRLLAHRASVLALPLTLLVGGMGTSAGLGVGLHRAGVAGAAELSRVLVEDEATGLGGAVGNYTAAIRALAATVGEEPALTDRGFQAMTATMASLPGVANVAYSVPVPDDPDAVQAAQERLRADLGTQLTLLPRPTKIGEHRFVVGYRGFDVVGSLLGIDVATTPQLTDAATAARDNGAVTVTAPYVLLADRALPREQQQQSVAFIAPVVGGSGQADEGSFRGWVAASFRTGTVLAASADVRTSVEAGLMLTDVSDRSDPEELGEVRPVADLADRSVATDLFAGSRRWQLTVTPTQETHDDSVGRSWVVAVVGGSLLSLLLAALLFSVTAGRDRARRQVERATVDLADEVASRRRSEESLRTRESELNAYTTVVADRLRLPLAQLSFMAEADRDNVSVSPEQFAERLASVEVRLDGARRLVDDLLLYARVSEVALSERTVDLFTVATAVADQQRAAAAHLPEGLQPRIDVSPLPEVVGEPWLLQQVIARLVDNAVVHAPAGQPAVVSVTSDLTGSRFRGEVWRVEVRDRGAGLPVDRRARVFEPFAGEDADVDLGSNHLSLAICRRILLRLGGDIGVDEDPRGGSVFWVTLPVRSTSGVPRGVLAAPGTAMPVMA